MMKHWITVIVFAASACSLPAQAQAVCCPIPSIERLRASVDLARQSLDRSIRDQGRSVVEQLVANNASQNRALQQQTHTLEMLLKSHAVTLNAMHAQRLYGAARPVQVNGKIRQVSAQSPSLCRQLAMARTLSKVPGIRLRAQLLLTEAQREHNEGFPSRNAATDRLRSTQRKHLDLLWMKQNVLNQEQTQQAVESIKNLVNPEPLPKLDNREKNTPQGRTYLARRALVNQKYQLAQGTLNDLLLLRAPLVKDKQGPNSVLGTMQDRVRNTIEDYSEDSWSEQLERKALAGLLRELNISLMHLYRLGVTELRSAQSTAGLLATLLANDTDRLRQSVEDEYLRLLSIDDDES